MKKLLSILLIAMFSFSYPVQEKEVSIKVTVQELNVILTSLQERPMKDVGTLVLKIVNQASPQLDSTKTEKKKN